MRLGEAGAEATRRGALPLRSPKIDVSVIRLMPYSMVGMDVAAVTSIVLTKSAARHVETVRNSSAVIFLSSLVAGPDWPVAPG
jgi:hypothetical protein